MSESKPKYHDPEWLRQKYWEEGMSAPQIADEVGVSDGAIRKWMKRHDIPRRSKSEAHRNRTRPLSERFQEKWESDGECWRWTGSTHTDDYGTISVDGEVKLAHRVSYYLDNGEWPTEMVLHTCDNPWCVNPDHLHEGSQEQNMLEASERNQVSQGEDRPLSKLTVDDVIEARERAATGESHQSIADDMPVNRRTLSRAISSDTWSHVEVENA